jgi:iron complex outermembrane recepter protein
MRMSKNFYIRFCIRLLLLLAVAQLSASMQAQDLAAVSANKVSQHPTTLNATTFNLKCSREPVTKVLKNIEQQSNFRFVYSVSVIEAADPVTLLAPNYDLEGVLLSITEQTGLQFKRIGNTISVAEGVKPAPRITWVRPAKTITGKVSDETGEPLIGATVAVKGGGRGAISDTEGQFSLNVPDNVSTLVVSYTGYQTQEVDISTGTNFNITLKEAGVNLNDVVVIGSRNQTRTKVETPVPVDVIPVQQVMNEVGQVDVNQLLTYVAPSFQSARQAISDGTDHVDPAQLRGLGPDQVLVLVNGKRRHQSALVNVNGTVNRGTVGTDLNAIPASAIERIEILRDGASAQYGSDAIAGVINIVLKKQTGLNASVSYGFNNTSYAKYSAAKRLLPAYSGVNENVSVTDGNTLQVGLSGGFKLGKRGQLNLMGEYTSRERTNRTGLYTGQIWPSVGGSDRSDSLNTVKGLTRDDFDMLIGNSQVKGGGVMYNFSLPVNNKVEIYSFGGFNNKKGNAAGFYRYPNAVPGAVRNNVLSVYPNGFLPEINSDVTDISVGAGVRTKLGEWNGDLSYVYGTNTFDFDITNSVNYTQALSNAQFSTEFDAGGLTFRQATLNADIARQFNLLSGLNFAFGGEFRQDGFAIRAGEEASYTNYNPAATVTAGAQVFPGFLPSNAIDSTRNIGAFYVDVEQDFSSRFMIGAAARFENYSDFGSTINGKLAARYKILENLSIRASASTGFRAPSQQQKYFAKTNTVFITQGGNLVPVEAGTFTNYSKPAELLGINPLKQETSVNLSGGITARLFDGFDLTIDYYSIAIKDRIVLTNNFTGGSDLVLDSLLKVNNASTANFFANAVDTRSNGLEAVLSYTKRFNVSNELRVSFAATRINNEVVKDAEGKAKINASETLIRTGQVGRYFNREDQSRIEVASPRAKANFTVNYRWKKLSIMVRNTYFGKVVYLDPTIDPSKPDMFPTNAFTGQKGTLDQTFSPKNVVDLTLSYQLVNGLNLAVGANNLFDTYQDLHTHSGNMSSGRFVFSRRVQQMGFNGRYLFARVNYTIR